MSFERPQTIRSVQCKHHALCREAWGWWNYNDNAMRTIYGGYGF